MNLRNRARRLFGRDSLSEHTVEASKVDHAVFRDVRKRAQAIADEIAKPPENADRKAWERLAEDLWSEFYGDDEPELKAREKIDPRFHVNRQMADKNARSESYGELHSMTRGEVMQSAIGLRGALRSMRESYGEELAEHAERQREIGSKSDEIDELDELLAQLRQDRNEIFGDPDAIDPQIRELAKAKRAAVDELKAAVAQQHGHAGDLIDAAKAAAAKATKDAAGAVRCSALMKGTSAGQARRVSPDVALELADRVERSSVLRAVLEMVGRMELSMGNVRRQQRKGGYEELVDIEMGNDLRVVLPAEKVLLTHPVARLDFFRRFHERSLMQYEMWSEEELKKGPLIFGADASGSTSGAVNVFIRGLTVASCMIANREKRNSCAIEFGSKGQMREFFFPAAHALDTAGVLDFAEHFFGGGTDINQVLARAKELIDGEAPFHTADLVIVTDGGDRLTPQTIEIRDALRAMGVKIHGIIVGARPTQYMIETCDHVSSVSDFAGPNSTSDRLAIDIS